MGEGTRQPHGGSPGAGRPSAVRTAATNCVTSSESLVWGAGGIKDPHHIKISVTEQEVVHPKSRLPIPSRGRVVDINALSALAPLPRAPSPGHHAPSPTRRPPLEPQAQRTQASGRADRARPAVTGMLGVRTAAVKRK